MGSNSLLLHCCHYLVSVNSSEVVFDAFLPFYNLTGIPGLQELPRMQDSNSPPIFVPGGLIYGAEEVTQVFVSENKIK